MVTYKIGCMLIKKQMLISKKIRCNKLSVRKISGELFQKGENIVPQSESS